MSFTGKSTYSAGASLPEIAEDVSDLVSINSPHDTPLLDAIGDAPRSARSTIHEWLEDTLLPNTDAIADSSITTPASDTVFTVANSARFRVGDQVRQDNTGEVMLVTAINSGTSELTVVRGYGGSATGNLVTAATLSILGNAALEGDSAETARFTSRTRKTNYTQIFSSTVEVSGSELAVRQIGIADELDYQKQQRTRELLRDLENCVINGRAPVANPQGSSSVRRTMRGIIPTLESNIFRPDVDGFPGDTNLSESALNFALRSIWTKSSGNVDLIVVNGREKRWINSWIASNRRFTPQSDTYRDFVGTYESDFGVCRVILSRWVPTGTVLLLDSSRIDVLPLAGRSFHYKPLGRTGDRESGQLVGEYTVEVRNENAHGMITALES